MHKYNKGDIVHELGINPVYFILEVQEVYEGTDGHYHYLTKNLRDGKFSLFHEEEVLLYATKVKPQYATKVKPQNRVADSTTTNTLPWKVQ